MTSRVLHLGAVFVALALGLGPAPAQLRGHGGPVRALAISSDGSQAISGSFDSSAIRWSLRSNAAEQVLRFHDGAVNAVALLKDGRIATSGEDARIAIWTPGEPQPSKVLEGHTAPVVALAISPDGTTVSIPVAPSARIRLNGVRVPLRMLKRGFAAETIRDGGAPAQIVDASRR